MKIGLISREYPPETGWGGIGSYTFELAHGLSDLGHEVHVIAFAPYQDQNYLDKKVQIHRLALKSCRGLWRFDNYFPVHQLMYSKQVANKVKALILEHGLQIIEAPEIGFESLFYSFEKTVPLVIKFHTPHFLLNALAEVPLTLKDHLICWLEKMNCKRADFFAAPSLRMAELMAERYQIDLKKIQVIPLPIDVQTFCPNGMVADNNLTVLFSGRLEVRKGVQVLTEAIPKVWAKVPEARFVFAGRDVKLPSEKRTMREFIQKKLNHSKQIVFTGHLTRKQLIEQYQQSRLCVMPSLWENFGYAGLEAMACGKPLIVSDQSGLTEFVSENSAVKVAARKSDVLAQAIIDLLQHPDKCRQLGQNGRREVEEKFTQRKVSQTIAEFYQEILNSKN